MEDEQLSHPGHQLKQQIRRNYGKQKTRILMHLFGTAEDQHQKEAKGQEHQQGDGQTDAELQEYQVHAVSCRHWVQALHLHWKWSTYD